MYEKCKKRFAGYAGLHPLEIAHFFGIKPRFAAELRFERFAAMLFFRFPAGHAATLGQRF
jgi:hypothetical protein